MFPSPKTLVLLVLGGGFIFLLGRYSATYALKRLERFVRKLGRRRGESRPLPEGDEIQRFTRSLVVLVRSLRGNRQITAASLESVQRTYGWLRVAQYLAQKALSIERQEEFWPLLAEHLCLFFSCDRVTVFQRGPKDEFVSLFAKKIGKPFSVKLGEGIAGHTAHLQSHYLTNDPKADPHFNPAMDQTTDYSTQNILAFPLVYQDRTLGVVELINKPGGFQKKDVEAVEYLGPQIAVFLVKFKMEKRQEELTHQMMQVEKMAAVGRLAAGVAHEVNNPLSAIRGFTQLLLRTMTDKPQAVKDLQKIDSESRRIQAIVKNLLGFSRLSPSAFSTVRLPEVIKDTLTLLDHELRRQKAEVVTEFDENVPPILADTNKLKQIFMNLTLNALQAMEGSSSVRLTFKVRIDAEKNALVASVGDNGPGIADENLDKIFEPFFTTKAVGSGTGLGLYVVLGIVDQHKGKITVDSVPGKGTTFNIRLPLAKETS